MNAPDGSNDHRPDSRTYVRGIQSQLRRSIEGKAWHGPALLDLIRDMDPEGAARRPITGAHTPWEILLHITAWMEIAGRYLDGDTRYPTDEENFPLVGAVDEAGWIEAREGLIRAHEALQGRLDAMADADLERRVAGDRYSAYVLLHGVVQHNLYHAGQIAILKKARPLPDPSTDSRVRSSMR